MLAYQNNEVLTKRDHDKLKATPNPFICFDKGGNANSLRPLIYLFLMNLMKVVTIYWLPGCRILYSYQNKRIRLLRQSLQGQKICLHPAIRTDFFLFGTPGIYISLRSILHDSHTLSTAYNF